MERVIPDRRLHEKQTPKNGLLVTMSTLAVAMTVDRVAGSRNRSKLGDAPSFLVVPREHADKTLVVATGCQTDGHIVAEMLHPEFAHDHNLVVIRYPDQGFDMDRISDALDDTLENRNLASDAYLGLSMGGLVVSRHLSRSGRRPEKVILDASPFGHATIRPKYRALLRTAQLLGDSHMANFLKPRFMQDAWKAGTHIGAIGAQGQFLRDFTMEPGELEDHALEAYYLGTPNDRVVDTDNAYENGQQIYGNLQKIVIDDLPPGTHTVTLDRPDVTENLMRQYPRYDLVA